MCNHNHDYMNMSSEDLAGLPFDCFIYPGENPVIDKFENNQFIDYNMTDDSSKSHSVVGPSMIELQNNELSCLEFFFEGMFYRKNGPAIIFFKNKKVISEQWLPYRKNHEPNEIRYFADGRVMQISYGNTNRWGDFTDCETGPSEVVFSYEDNVVTVKKKYCISNKLIGIDLDYSNEKWQDFYRNYKIL